MSTILMARGIECSYPKVQGGTRRDQLFKANHSDFWREDLRLCADLRKRFAESGREIGGSSPEQGREKMRESGTSGAR